MDFLTAANTVEGTQQLSAIEQYLEQLWPKVIHFGLQLLWVAVVLLLGRKLIAFLRRWLKRSLEHSSADVGLMQFLDGLVKYVLYFILFLVVLGNFGIEATSIFALAGSAGLTFGLAMQGSLSNFAGGVLILLLKPFRVGDYIIEDTHKNEGTVENIQLFYTTLRTVDSKKITIPNATLANTSLTNVTGAENRMLAIKVGITYESDLRLAKQILLDIYKSEEKIQKDKEYQAFVSELADSSVVMEARGWVKTEEYFPVRWKLLEEIKCRFDEQGVVIAYPQMEIHIVGQGEAPKDGLEKSSGKKQEKPGKKQTKQAPKEQTKTQIR